MLSAAFLLLAAQPAGDYGTTALMQAVARQDLAAVQAALKSGEKINAQDQDSLTALALACEQGDAPVTAALLDAGADGRLALADGSSALHICARFGPPSAVARIVSRGTPADLRDARGQTPLMWAAAAGQAEAVAALIRAGAAVNATSTAGFSPFLFAVKAGSVEAMRALLAAGANPDFRGPENTSAAQLAAYQSRWAALGALLDMGKVDLAERDREGWQVLHRIAAGGDAALLGQALQKGAALEGLLGPSRITWVTEANFGRPPPPVLPQTPLMIAAGAGEAATMRALIAAGANARFTTQTGENILLAAARSGNVAALEVAIAATGNPNYADKNGTTALHILASGGAKPELPALLALLAKSGAKADLANAGGKTPVAIAQGSLNAVRIAFQAAFPAPMKP